MYQFLIASSYNPAELIVFDKIIGKAAALLMIKMGIKRVRAQILSEPAQQALEYFDIAYSYDKLVKRITCKTEELLLHEFDPQKGYELLQKLIEKK